MSSFRRCPEVEYDVHPYIAEFRNTISNLVFVIIGLIRLSESETEGHIWILYWWFTLAGIGSGIHHMAPIKYQKYTIIIDWIPISISLCLLPYYYSWGLFTLISAVTWVKVFLATITLITDHLGPVIPVPWGHVAWHILAAFSVDAVYQDLING